MGTCVHIMDGCYRSYGVALRMGLDLEGKSNAILFDHSRIGVFVAPWRFVPVNPAPSCAPRNFRILAE